MMKFLAIVLVLIQWSDAQKNETVDLQAIAKPYPKGKSTSHGRD